MLRSFKVSELNNLRNDLRQLMEIAQQLEPYVVTEPQTKSGSSNRQQDYRKKESDPMEFSSGSQFSSSVPMPSTEGSAQIELCEEYKRRSVS